MHPRPLLLLAAFLAQAAAPARPPAAAPTPPPPPAASARELRDVVRAAEAALQGDSVARVRERWDTRLRANPADQVARLGLASLARLTLDYQTAERHYAALAGGADSLAAAYARLGRAFAFTARGQVADAAPLYEASVPAGYAVGAPDVTAEALLVLAGRRSGAARHPVFDSVAALIEPGDAYLRAQLHCRRAALARDLDADVRRAQADSGTALARQAGSLLHEGRCLAARARVEQDRSESATAIAFLRRAEAVHARAHDDVELANSLARQGYEHTDLGDYGAALSAMRQALAVATRVGNYRWVGQARVGIAAVSLRVNDFTTMKEQLYAAEQLATAARDTSLLSFVHSYQGDLALARGDVKEAKRLFTERLDVNSRDDNVNNLILTHRSLAHVAMKERDWAAAEREIEAMRVLGEKHGLTDALEELTDHQGKLALLRGDLAAAERYYKKSLSTLDSSQHSLNYGIRARLAEVYAGKGDLARAERELAAGSDDIDAWRATLDDENLRLLAAELCGCADQDLGVPKVLAALAGGGRVDAAFVLAERRRARELVNRMMQAEVLRDSTSSSTALRERAARQAVRVTAAEAAAALPDDRTALLEYVTGPDGAPTTLFLLTRTALARAFRLPPIDSLGEQVGRFVALVESGGDPRALGRTLGAALLDSAVAAAGPAVTRLVVVPDGVLHRLPFDALRLADDRYAVERYTIGVAPSAAVARTLWRRSERRAPESAEPPRILAFGDPSFPGEREAAGGRAAAYRSAFDSVGGLARLAGSGREAQLVSRYTTHGVARLRGDASEAYLKRAARDNELRGVRVLHFATHALVDDRSAARTALALAPGGGEDGFVSPGDLAALPIGADLVVLSACRSAGGALLGGEGVRGLTAPLLEAGARSVVATGWKIDDRSTVAFVDDVYGGLARGLPVGDALRAAKLAAIARGAAPREWAAFGVVGDPLVTVPLQLPPARPRWWLVAAAGLAVGAALAFAVRRRRR
jgi:tetratricopeptide (TPR) repeat protein